MKRWHLTEKLFIIRCILLILVMLFNYFLLTPHVVSFFGSEISYWLEPVFWLGITFLIYIWPWVKIHGRSRYQVFLRYWAFNFAIIYILASVCGGLFDGFGRSPYNHSISGIMQNFIQVGLVLIGREQARSFLVNSLTKKVNYGVFVLIALFMTIINFPLSRFFNLHDYKNIIEFSAQYFAPEFLMNFLAVYFVYLGGPVPSLIYLGTIQAFHWLCPVLPNLKWITAALIGTLCPVFSFLSLRRSYSEECRERCREKREEDSPVNLLVSSLVSIIIIWFSVGVFPVYPSVVATGSMEPLIKPGDVILVEKVKPGFSYKIGDIIQFRQDNILISHRIVEIVKEEKSLGYQTKGDNNSGVDSQIVKPEDVKGRVLHVIPKIGWPSLFLKSDK